MNRGELARFNRMVKVATDSGCWLWQGELSRNGYGRHRVGPGQPLLMAHRISYEHHVGQIPEGLQLDHTCRERRCVNPAHLEPVTNAENTKRQDHAARRKTECPKGHPYDDANTYVDPSGARRCRACAKGA